MILGWRVAMVLVAGSQLVVMPPSRAAEPTGQAADYAAELPRIRQTGPADAPATMRIRPGFALDLAVAEPLVASPVAIAWDEDGLLFVAEMRGYSEQRDDRLGRIRLLHDDDRDGTYDRATAFATDLAWPTAVVPWGGGVFVGDAPDILWLKDLDGDGVADERRRVLTGFGTGNVQGLFNSFAFGVDGRIHGAGSSSGGDVGRCDAAGRISGPTVAIRGRDFSFHPRSLDIRPETGGAQHGRSTDDLGDVYLCHNSDHAIRCMVDDRFLGRNPFFTAPTARESIAVEGPQAAVYRSSPVEPWRALRTRLRAAGLVPGVVEGGGRPAGYFTSATGITFVRGDMVGDLAGMLVVGDVGSNLVHRKRLLPHGAGVRAERVDAESELVASTDTWFRPVQFANGPDGAVWIVDMQREVIEHPASLAPPIKKHLDLTSGRESGRLWRLVAAGKGSPQSSRRPTPRLSRATTPELIALLGHSNGWHRDTARRLLAERADPASVQLLHTIVADTDAAVLARVHAAHVLATLDALTAADLLAMLTGSEPRVRTAAVRLAERLPVEDSPAVAALTAALVRMADDEPRIDVRFALALLAGGLADTPRKSLVRKLLERDGADPWCRYAVFTSLRGDAGAIVEAWIADPVLLMSSGPTAALPGLVAQVGRRRDPDELARIIAGIDRMAASTPIGTTDPRTVASLLLAELARSLPKAGGDLLRIEPVARTRSLVASLAAHNASVATDRTADHSRRILAVRSLAIADGGGLDVLRGLLTAEERPDIVRAVIETLDQLRDPRAADVLVAALPRLPPESRPAATAALTRDAARIMRLLDAVASGTVPAADLDRQTAAAAWAFPDRAVAVRAIEVLGSPPPAGRDALVAAYRASLPPSGDRERGRAIFVQQCAACHRVEGVGKETGPALAAMQARGSDAMLLAILDPNREVLPAYVAHAAVTAEGRVITGIVTAQSEGSVTLRSAEGADTTISRGDLESLTDTKRSLMPEGFEKTIDARGMADLLAYLMSAK